MAWVSPTSYIDYNNKWSNEANIYDENTGTAASTGTTGFAGRVGVTPSSEISCSKIRIFMEEIKGATSYDPDISITVWYNESWYSIWSGQVTKSTWVEIPIGSTEDISVLRLYWTEKQAGGATLYWYEADFWEVEAPPSYIPQIMMVT